MVQIIIPNSVTKIEWNSFNDCASLTQIAIPSSVTKIEWNAFNGCISLKQITIPSSVTSIELNAFNHCSSLIQIIIPSSVTKIGNGAFKRCSSLTQVSIPSSITSIGDDTFSECSSLKQIEIPSSVTSIGKKAFFGCILLAQISIPSSVTSIGINAFDGCTSLSAETLLSINSKQSSITNNKNVLSSLLNSKNNDNPTLLQNNKPALKININSTSNVNHAWNPNINIKKDNLSSLVSKNSIPLINSNKLSSINWSKSGETSKQNKYSWNANSNIKTKNTPSMKINDNKASSLKFNNKNPSLEDKNNEKIMNEFEIMKMLDHPNVIKAIDIIHDDKKAPSILLEECPTGLNYAIQNKILSNVQLVYSIYQIAEGMKYIHSRKVFHLNLKPTSILISDDGTIKISDFKNAQRASSENEVKANDDIYSFGKIVYFILSGREISNSEKEVNLDSFSQLAQHLIYACFFDDIERRPTFEIICNILKENDFNLISLSQQEIEDLSKLISQYQQTITH